MKTSLRYYWPLALVLVSGIFGPAGYCAELKQETVHSWNRYVQATEGRIASELKAGAKFYAQDFLPQSEAAAENRSVREGKVAIRKMVSLAQGNAKIEVPGGMIHHWRGSVLIPGATLAYVLARVEDPTKEQVQQEDVLDSRVLRRGPDSLRLYLKLQRSKIVTVVYNTEHDVRYGRQQGSRAWSTSTAVRIAEVISPNSPDEREKPQGQDHGFLWRLNSYWKYGQVPEGVAVECESISLSRSIPAGLEFLVRPLIDRVARESMERTLNSMRDRIVRANRSSQFAVRSSRLQSPTRNGAKTEPRTEPRSLSEN